MFAASELQSNHNSGRAWEYLSNPAAAQTILSQMSQVMQSASPGSFQSLQQFQKFAEDYTAANGSAIGIDIHNCNNSPELLYYLRENPNEKTISPFLSKQLGLDPTQYDLSANRVMENLQIPFVRDRDLTQGLVNAAQPSDTQSQAQPEDRDWGSVGKVVLDAAAESVTHASEQLLQRQQGLLTGIDLIAGGLLVSGAGAKLGIAVGAAGLSLIKAVKASIHARKETGEALSEPESGVEEIVHKMDSIAERTSLLETRASAVEIFDRTEQLESRTTALATPEAADESGLPSHSGGLDAAIVDAPAFAAQLELAEPQPTSEVSVDEVSEAIADHRSENSLVGAMEQLGKRIDRLVSKITPDDEVQQFTLDTQAPIAEQIKQIKTHLDYLNQRLDRLEAKLDRLEAKNRPLDSPDLERAEDLPSEVNPAPARVSAQESEISILHPEGQEPKPVKRSEVPGRRLASVEQALTQSAPESAKQASVASVEAAKQPEAPALESPVEGEECIQNESQDESSRTRPKPRIKQVEL